MDGWPAIRLAVCYTGRLAASSAWSDGTSHPLLILLLLFRFSFIPFHHYLYRVFVRCLLLWSADCGCWSIRLSMRGRRLNLLMFSPLPHHVQTSSLQSWGWLTFFGLRSWRKFCIFWIKGKFFWSLIRQRPTNLMGKEFAFWFFFRCVCFILVSRRGVSN